MQCRSHAAQLGRSYESLKAANCEVLVILGDPLDKAVSYASSLHLPFPVLADPGREVYHRYGLEKALFVIQRTASVVVDNAGKIAYIKSVTSAMEWLKDIQDLVQLVKSLP